MKNIGILTGGGDCPGLNGVIRAVVKRAAREGVKTTGVKNGWKGMIEADTMPLAPEAVADILSMGGTILGTSRTNPYKRPEDVKKVIDNYRAMKLDGLVAVGGEDTLGVANKLVKEGKGLNIVGCPKTIDNDLNATDFTFGFDTAVNIAMEAIDRLKTTAASHHRVMVAEVMGRHAGWIAMHSGIASSADAILIPEVPADVDEICEIVKRSRASGKGYSIIVAAEGAQLKNVGEVTKEKQLDAFGHVILGGIGETLANLIEQKTGCETRSAVFGHIQRGGSPTAFDRVISTKFGVRAAELALEGRSGYMASLQGTEVGEAPIEKAVGTLKTVDGRFYETAKIFFG